MTQDEAIRKAAEEILAVFHKCVEEQLCFVTVHAVKESDVQAVSDIIRKHLKGP